MRYEELQNKRIKTGISLLYIILILPFLSVAGVRSLVGGLYSVWQAGSMYTLVIIVLVKAKYAKVDKFVMALAAYEVTMLAIATFYSGFSFGFMVVSMVFILLAISMQFYRDEIIQALAAISIGVILVNLVSVLGRMVGAEGLYFLGGKNQFSMFMIPAAAFIIINALQRRNNLNFFEIFVLICSVVSIILGASGTGIVCTLLAIVLFVSNRMVSNKRMLFISLLIINGIIIFAFEYIVESETWLQFTDWLGKDPTMTGRTTIWETSLDMVEGHWLFGLGRSEKLIYLSRDEFWVSGFETHNMFLQVLFTTGLVGVVLFVRYLYMAIKKLNMHDITQRVLLIAIFICMVNGLVEANNNNTFFRILIALAYYSETLRKQAIAAKAKSEEGDEISVGTNEETAT